VLPGRDADLSPTF